VQKTVQKGIAPKSQVSIVFSGALQYTDANLLALRTVTMLLQGRLFDTIRQQLGGTYSIEVEPLTQKFPRSEYSVRITWACDPARVDTLVQRVFDEIAFVKRTPLQPLQVERIRAALRRDFDDNSQDNGYLLNQIVRRYEDGNADGVGNVFNVPDQIAALTGGQIQQAAQTFLSSENYVKVTLMPETK
jgi:zinc protease